MSIKVEIRQVDRSEVLSVRFPPGSKGVVDGGSFAGAMRDAETQQSDAAQALEKYMNMTPEERTAMALRKQLGISEDAYAAMSPDEKKAVDAKVAQLIKQKLDEQLAKQQQGVSSMAPGMSL
jgi:hypothetical protein